MAQIMRFYVISVGFFVRLRFIHMGLCSSPSAVLSISCPLWEGFGIYMVINQSFLEMDYREFGFRDQKWSAKLIGRKKIQFVVHVDYLNIPF